MTENIRYHIGGGPYALMRKYRPTTTQEWEQDIVREYSKGSEHRSRILGMPRTRLVKNMWLNLKEIPDDKPGVSCIPADTGKWQWIMLNSHWNDIYQYKLTQQDYYKIAKFATEKWARDEGHRVRADVLSPEQYYTICKIMAEQGVCWSLDHEKLQNVGNLGLCNPVSDIILTALKNMRDEWRREEVFDYMSRNKEVYSGLLKLIAPPTNHSH